MSSRAHLRVAAGFAAAALFLAPARGLAEKRKLSIEDPELQIQPREKHGFRGTDSLTFRNQAIVRFFEEHL